MSKDFVGQVAVKALIVKNDKVLIVRDHHDGALWELPGGHININESIEDALVREVHEELGIDIKIGTLLHSEQLIHKSRGTPHLFIICTATFINHDQPLRVPSEEIAEIRWIDKKSVEGLQFHKESAHALEIFWRART